MLKYIDMNAVVIVCFLSRGLLAIAYPLDQYDADVASTDDAVFAVEGEAAFRDIAPAPEPESGSVSLYGKCDGSYVPIPEPSLLYFEDLPVQESDDLDVLSDTARFGSALADSILAERAAEIEAELAEIDAFVESQFGETNSRVASTLLQLSDAIDSDLGDMKSDHAFEFENIDDLESESELALAAAQLESKVTADMARTESLVMKELTKVDSLVESELKNTEALMESEIDKVNSYIESKIAQNDALMESEVSKINSFIDSELAKTEALMQLELEKINSFVDSELAKTECMMTSELSKLNSIMDSKLGNVETDNSELTMLEVPVEGVVEFSGVAPVAGRTKIYGNTGYIPVITNLDSNYEETETPAMGEVEYYDTVPVSGRTRIVGYTGYLEPNLTPLKATPAVNGEDIYRTVAVNNEVEIIPDTEMSNDDVATMPVVGEVIFSGKAPAVGRVKITGNCEYIPVITNLDSNYEETETPAMGEVEYYDTVPVSGRTRIVGYSGYLEPNLTPLKATPAVNGEDIYRTVPVNNDVEIIPDTEMFNDDVATIPVVGEAIFSGKAPAVGRVKITGNSACPTVFPMNPPVVGNANPSIQNNVQDFDGDLYSRLANGESDAPNVPRADGVFPINILPIVNILRKEFKVTENGDIEFSATVKVASNTNLAAEFECAPLLPTEETPDGRKFIWLSKKSNGDETPTPPEPYLNNNPPEIDIPITTYSTDFPETIILDSNKNYERFLDIHEKVTPVAGEVFFEGIAPAHGSVNIRGQSSF